MFENVPTVIGPMAFVIFLPLVRSVKFFVCLEGVWRKIWVSLLFLRLSSVDSSRFVYFYIFFCKVVQLLLLLWLEPP